MGKTPDLEKRLTQKHVEDRLNDAVGDIILHPDVVKIKNFKQGLDICKKKGYDVSTYYDVYNGLIVEYSFLFETGQPQSRRAKDICLEDDYHDRPQ